MDKNQNIFINNDRYTIDTFADDFVNKSTSYDKGMDVYIRADQNLAYKDIMYLLKSVKQAGFARVSLITQ
jgi:biopolymer transport protein ExbD